MKASELIKLLSQYPDFELEFICSEPTTVDNPWPEYKVFQCLEVVDIGHSDKKIILGGTEV